MTPSQRTSLLLSIFISFLLIADGTLVLYACLLWPKPDVEHGDPLFVVGVVTFVVCFTLPFVLVAGFVACTLCYRRRHGNKSCCSPFDILPKFNCCLKNTQSSSSSSAQKQLDNLHRLDLLPPNFVQSNFGTLVQASLARGCREEKRERVSTGNFGG